MIDTNWRGYFQPIFDALGKIFVHLNIKPNTITFFALVIGLLSGAGIALGKPILGIVLLWVSGLLDVLDGSVARLTAKSSKAGAYMDLIFDRMVEAAVILGFAWFFPEGYFAYLLFFVSVIFNFTTFVVAGALFKNQGRKSMHYDVGIAERTETFIVFTIMALFSNFIFGILMVFNIIIFITGMIRFAKVLRVCETEEF